MRVSLPGDRGDLYDTGEHLGGAEAAVAVHVKKDDTGLESVGKLNNGLFPGEAQIIHFKGGGELGPVASESLRTLGND